MSDARHFFTGPPRYLWQDPDTGEAFEMALTGEQAEAMVRWAQAGMFEMRVSDIDEEAGTITFSNYPKDP